MATVTIVSVNVDPMLTPSIKSKIDHLATIVRDHERDWNDPFSEKLKKWSNQLFRIILDVNLTIEEKIKLGQKKLDELSTAILIDPLTKQILREPVLERKWTWEKEMHIWYFQHTLPPRSPFDKQLMMQNPKTHDFAQKMVDWLKYFEIKREMSEEKEEGNRNDIVPYAQRPMDELNRFEILRLAANAVFARNNEEMRMALANDSVKQDESIKMARELHQEKLKVVRARAERHEEENRANLEAIKESVQSMQSKIQMLETEMAKQEARHIAEMEAVLHQMESQDQANSQTAEAMMRKLEKMKVDHKQNIDSLKKQIHEMQEKIAEAVQRFNCASQLNRERAKIHEQIIKDRRCEVQQAFERISDLHLNLSAKEGTIAQLTQQVAELNLTLQYAHQRINDMPSPDNDRCMIM